jgi:hypothetical protein
MVDSGEFFEARPAIGAFASSKPLVESLRFPLSPLSNAPALVRLETLWMEPGRVALRQGITATAAVVGGRPILARQFARCVRFLVWRHALCSGFLGFRILLIP